MTKLQRKLNKMKIKYLTLILLAILLQCQTLFAQMSHEITLLPDRKFVSIIAPHEMRRGFINILAKKMTTNDVAETYYIYSHSQGNMALINILVIREVKTVKKETK